MDESDLVYRLRKRAEISSQISTSKSVQEGKEDRLSLLLEEAADEIERLREQYFEVTWDHYSGLPSTNSYKK